MTPIIPASPVFDLRVLTSSDQRGSRGQATPCVSPWVYLSLLVLQVCLSALSRRRAARAVLVSVLV